MTLHSIIKKAKKGINIHHPLQWITLIEKASQKNPFKVTSMSAKDFFNLKWSCWLIPSSYKGLNTFKRQKKSYESSLVENKRDQMRACSRQDFRYNVSSAFQSVVIGSVPRKTKKSCQELFNLPELYKEELPLSKALLKVILEFLIH